MPTGKQAEDQRTITISIAKGLVEKIDLLAKKDRRKRSQWIVKELEIIVDEYEKSELNPNLSISEKNRRYLEDIGSTQNTRLNAPNPVESKPSVKKQPAAPSSNRPLPFGKTSSPKKTI